MGSIERGSSLSRATNPAVSENSGPSGVSLDYSDCPAASQAQLIRAHQRDSGQIHRLTELTSELIRSLAGTRWLAHKQTIVNLLVRAVYLCLTFGRGTQTFGEEYTDVLPYHASRRRPPTIKRRLATILFLLLPTILTSPSTIAHLRSSSETDTEGPWSRLKIKLARWAESPLGKALPELHMVAFMFSGRFFEFGKRLTGIRYISTLPPKPPGQESASFEPLALVMLFPVLYRFFPSSTITEGIPSPSVDTRLAAGPRLTSILPLSPPPTPPLSAEENIILTKAAAYDTSNTYLSAEALELPERQCTLCLEPRGTGEGSGGTVAVTECGHIFCWGCLGGLEKPECPLCRQSLRMERLIPAYNL